jgi:hypothetical protein
VSAVPHEKLLHPVTVSHRSPSLVGGATLELPLDDHYTGAPARLPCAQERDELMAAVSR